MTYPATGAFQFVMNEQPAEVRVHDPRILSFAFASYGMALRVQFTVAEARGLVDAMQRAIDAAEQLPAQMMHTGGTA